ncbi:MAG: polysaccharide pyruvyl transferase family protein [Thermodesulfobacteriota bacterium]
MNIFILDWSGHNAKMDDILNLCARRLIKNALSELNIPITFVNKAKYADVLVIGGGTILYGQDKTFYKTIENFKGPYFILGSGYRGDELGTNNYLISETKNILKKAVGVGVRGPYSYDSIASLGTDMSNIEVVGDIALQFEPRATNLQKSNYDIGISVRYMGRTGELQYVSNRQVYRIVVDIIELLNKEHPGCQFYLFDTCWNIHDSDKRGLRKVIKLSSIEKNRFRWVITKDLEMFCSIMGQMDIMVSQRLHPNILAWTQGVPSIALDYKNNKAVDFMKTLDVEMYTIKTSEFSLKSYEHFYREIDRTKADLVEIANSKIVYYKKIQKEYVKKMFEKILFGSANIMQHTN